jgi:hypothetical protein
MYSESDMFLRNARIAPNYMALNTEDVKKKGKAIPVTGREGS